MVVRLVGINVVDEAGYRAYREKMTPLLHRAGGSFGVDVEVARVLLPEGGAPFNRLFTILFPSAEALKAFFADPAYLAIRAEHLAGSVSDITAFGYYDARD